MVTYSRLQVNTKDNKDVVVAGCMRNMDGSNVGDDDKNIIEIWKRYYEKLMNKEFV